MQHKSRLTRTEFSNNNSYFDLKVEAVTHVWDTEGNQKKFYYNKTHETLTILDNIEAIYVHYIPLENK